MAFLPLPRPPRALVHTPLPDEVPSRAFLPKPIKFGERRVEVDEERRKRIRQAFKGLDTLNPDVESTTRRLTTQQKARGSNIAYLSDAFKLEPKQVASVYDSFRGFAAKSLFNTLEDPGDEGLYGLISERFQWEDDVRLESEKAAKFAAAKALTTPFIEAPDGERRNIPWTVAYSEFQGQRDTPKHVDSKAEKIYEQVFRQAYESKTIESEPVRAFGRDLLKELESDISQETEALDRLSPERMEQLEMMTPDERQEAYAFIGANVDLGRISEDFAKNTSKTLIRSFADPVRHFNFAMLGSKIAQVRETSDSGLALLEPLTDDDTPEEILSKVTAPSRLDRIVYPFTEKATPQEAARIREAADRAKTRMDIRRELRDLRQGVINPVKTSSGFAGKIWYPALDQIGFMATAAHPLTIGAFVGVNSDMRMEELKANGVPEEAARNIGILSSLAEFPMERLQVKMLLGKPFGRAFGKWQIDLKQKLGGMGVFGANLSSNLIIQNAQELGQDMMPFVMQSLATRLNEEIPEVNWEKTIDDLKGSRMDTFLALLPFAALGAGVGTARDVSSIRHIMDDAARIEAMGVPKADAENIAKLSRVDPAEAVKEFQKVEKTKPNVDEFNQEAGRVDEMIKSPERPQITVLDDGRAEIEFEDGSTSIVADVETAHQAVQDTIDTRVEEARKSMLELQNNFEKTTKTKFVKDDKVQTLENVFQEGVASAEQVRQRIQDLAVESGNEFGNNAFSQFRVYAQNEAQFRNGVFENVVRLFKGENPFAVVEDVSEGFWKKWAAEGEAGKIAGWLQEYHNLSGDQVAAGIADINIAQLEKDIATGNLENSTDFGKLIEAASALSTAYFSGKVQESSLSNGIKKLFQQLATYFQYVFDRATRLQKAFEGGLSTEFENRIAESVGLPTKRVDPAREAAKVRAALVRAKKGFSADRDLNLDTSFPDTFSVSPVQFDTKASESGSLVTSVIVDGVPAKGPTSMAFETIPNEDQFRSEQEAQFVSSPVKQEEATVRRALGKAWDEVDISVHRIQNIALPDNLKGQRIGQALRLAHYQAAMQAEGKPVFFYNSQQTPEAARSTMALARKGLIDVELLSEQDKLLWEPGKPLGPVVSSLSLFGRDVDPSILMTEKNIPTTFNEFFKWYRGRFPTTFSVNLLPRDRMVLKAYDKEAIEGGEWVSLTALRSRASFLDREQFDKSLVSLARNGVISLVADDNTSGLTQADRDAAIEFGGEQKHLIRRRDDLPTTFSVIQKRVEELENADLNLSDKELKAEVERIVPVISVVKTVDPDLGPEEGTLYSIYPGTQAEIVEANQRGAIDESSDKYSVKSAREAIMARGIGVEGIIPDIPVEFIDMGTTFSVAVPSLEDALEGFFNPPDFRLEAYEKLQDRLRKINTRMRKKRIEAEERGRDVSPFDVTEAIAQMEAILSALPLPVSVRGKVKGFTTLSEKTTDRGRLTYLLDRMNRADAVLDEFIADDKRTKLRALLKRSMPKKVQGKLKSSLGPEMARFVQEVAKAIDMDAEQVDVFLTNAQRIVPDDLADISLAIEKETIVEMFGNLDGMDALQAERALDQLREAIAAGRAAFKMKQEERQNQIQGLIGDALEGLKAPAQPDPEKVARSVIDEQKYWKDIGSVLKNFVVEHLSFQQALQTIFGYGETMLHFEKLALKAKNDFIDANLTRRKEMQDWMAENLGLEKPRNQYAWLTDLKKVQEEKTGVFRDDRSEMALSQDEAIYYTMVWDQEQYQKNLAEKDGINAGTIAQMEEFLTAEARQYRAFLRRQYDKEYDRINKVYREIHGVDMPRVNAYAPVSVDLGEGRNMDTDPLNNDMFTSGLSAGFTKLRTQHNFPVMRRGASVMYWAHNQSANYYVSHALFARDAKQVLLDKSVVAGIKVNKQPRRVKVLSTWIQQFHTNGLRRGATLLAAETMMARLNKTITLVGLSLNVGSAMKQLSAFAASLAQVPVSHWVKGAGGLAFNPSRWLKMFRSPTMQRRVMNGMSVEMQTAMSAGGHNPGFLLNAMHKGLYVVGHTDAALTSISAAIAYDYHLGQARKMTSDPATQEQLAMEMVDRTVARTAQPTANVDRSVREIIADTQPFLRLYIMFKSEMRQKAAVSIMGVREMVRLDSTLGERAAGARAAFTMWFFLPFLTHIVTEIYAEVFRDDDEDEGLWDRLTDVKTVSHRLLSGQSAGLFYGGEALEVMSAMAFDQETWLTTDNALVQGVANLFSLSMSDESFVESFLQEDGFAQMSKAGRAVSSTLGALDTRAAAAGVITRVIRDIAAGVQVEGVDVASIFGAGPTPLEATLAELKESQDIITDAKSEISAERREIEAAAQRGLPREERELLAIFKSLSNLQVGTGHRARGIHAFLQSLPESQREAMRKRLKDEKILSTNTLKQLRKLEQ